MRHLLGMSVAQNKDPALGVTAGSLHSCHGSATHCCVTLSSHSTSLSFSPPCVNQEGFRSNGLHAV